MARCHVRLTPLSLTDCFQAVDQLRSLPTILIVETVPTHPHRLHNVVYSGHIWRKEIPSEECPFVVPLHRKLHQHFTTALYNPTVDALHADMNTLGSPLTEFEPPPKDSRALVAKWPEISLEIPDTPAALENVWHEDDHSDDGNIPLSFMMMLVAETDRT
jgi:hypothetical protein